MSVLANILGIILALVFGFIAWRFKEQFFARREYWALPPIRILFEKFSLIASASLVGYMVGFYSVEIIFKDNIVEHRVSKELSTSETSKIVGTYRPVHPPRFRDYTPPCVFITVKNISDTSAVIGFDNDAFVSFAYNVYKEETKNEESARIAANELKKDISKWKDVIIPVKSEKHNNKYIRYIKFKRGQCEFAITLEKESHLKFMSYNCFDFCNIGYSILDYVKVELK